MYSKALSGIAILVVMTFAWGNDQDMVYGEVVALENKKGDQPIVAIDESKGGLIPGTEGRIIHLAASHRISKGLQYLENRKIRAEGNLYRDKNGLWKMDVITYRLMAEVIGRIRTPEIDGESQLQFLVNAQKSAMFKTGPTDLLITGKDSANLREIANKEVIILGFMSINAQEQREFEVVECRPYEECVGKIVVNEKSVQFHQSDRIFHIIASDKERELASLHKEIVRIWGLIIEKGEQKFLHVMEYTIIEPSK